MTLNGQINFDFDVISPRIFFYEFFASIFYSLFFNTQKLHFHIKTLKLTFECLHFLQGQRMLLIKLL